ncbi:ABC transporter permease, partial [Rhizobium brockwellii]
MSAGRSGCGRRVDWIGLLFACRLTLFIAL